MAERTCSIDGCDRPHYGRGWCRIHLGRWQRTGDPGAAVPIVTRRQNPPDGPCSVDGCERPADNKHGSRGLCRSHQSRLDRTGDLNVAVPVREHYPDASDITYYSFHARMRKARGSAAEQHCACCDRTAGDWAYVHGRDPRDFDSYVPMCRSCHIKYDKDPAGAYMGGPAKWPGRHSA